jgi:hypothetical protein
LSGFFRSGEKDWQVFEKPLESLTVGHGNTPLIRTPTGQGLTAAPNSAAQKA